MAVLEVFANILEVFFQIWGHYDDYALATMIFHNDMSWHSYGLEPSRGAFSNPVEKAKVLLTSLSVINKLKGLLLRFGMQAGAFWLENRPWYKAIEVLGRLGKVRNGRRWCGRANGELRNEFVFVEVDFLRGVPADNSAAVIVSSSSSMAIFCRVFILTFIDCLSFI